MYLKLHRSLFRPPSAVLHAIRLLFTRDAAAVARDLRWHIAAVAALFVSCVAAGWWLVHTFPEPGHYIVRIFPSSSSIALTRIGRPRSSLRA